jgi:hypothetical protein
VAKPKQVRWKCPNDIHAGVLGPSRPRRDNLCRYCIPCSQRVGKLVERVAPTVEKQREVQAAHAKQKRETKTRRAKEKEKAYYVIAGVNLQAEMKRLVKLKAFGGRQGRMARQIPNLVVRRCKSHPRTRLGSASPWENKIIVAAYPGQDAADVRETLIHELVHIYCGYDRSDKRHWHGTEFRSKFREAVEEAYGFWPRITSAYHGSVAQGLRGHNGGSNGSTTRTQEVQAPSE